jgi:glutaredoxin 3
LLDDKADQIDPSAIAVHDVDTMEGGGHVKTTLLRLNSQRLYPSLYVNGKHIGGNDTLLKLNETGELDKLLAKQYPSKWAIK